MTVPERSSLAMPTWSECECEKTMVLDGFASANQRIQRTRIHTRRQVLSSPMIRESPTTRKGRRERRTYVGRLERGESAVTVEALATILAAWASA